MKFELQPYNFRASDEELINDLRKVARILKSHSLSKKEYLAHGEYWAKRRWKWDEWGSPVGLGLGWALFIVPLGAFLYFLHLAGILR